jgi:hypothetical protein
VSKPASVEHARGREHLLHGHPSLQLHHRRILNGRAHHRDPSQVRDSYTGVLRSSGGLARHTASAGGTVMRISSGQEGSPDGAGALVGETARLGELSPKPTRRLAAPRPPRPCKPGGRAADRRRCPRPARPALWAASQVARFVHRERRERRRSRRKSDPAAATAGSGAGALIGTFGSLPGRARGKALAESGRPTTFKKRREPQAHRDARVRRQCSSAPCPRGMSTRLQGLAARAPSSSLARLPTPRPLSVEPAAPR